MQLKNIIFHGLVTKRSQTSVFVDKNEEELPLDENANALLAKARGSYNKDSGVAYAKFGHGWFPDYLQKLIDKDIEFLDFSTYGVDELEKRIRRQSLTTGGYLFFIFYEEDNAQYVMTLLLKDIQGLAIDKSKISERHILNLDKLHFGARINVNRWKANESGYISFLKGPGRQEVTEYFKDFLCIDDSSFNDPKKNTRALVKVVKEFCSENYSDEKERFQVRARVESEIRTKIENKDPITITNVASLVFPDDSEKFVRYVNDSDLNIPNEFQANKTELKRLSRLSGRNKDISISFESDVLENGRVKFKDIGDNVPRPQLIIEEIPQELLEELRKAHGH